MLRATVSGSFHRHMAAIYAAVGELRALGVDVLSPSDPRIVDHIGEFLFVASDRLRSIRLVQDRHFEAIRASDFLWLVCPDGYTGPSASAEIGAAYAYGIPVFSVTAPLDITLQNYVRRVSSASAVISAIEGSRNSPAEPQQPNLLLDPEHAIGTSIGVLEHLRLVMTARTATGPGQADSEVDAARRVLRATLGAN